VVKVELLSDVLALAHLGVSQLLVIRHVKLRRLQTS
jgi:hypothetical protein